MGIFSFLFGESEAEAAARVEAEAAAAIAAGLPSAEQWKDPFGWFVEQLREFGESQCQQVGLRVDRQGSECELRAMWSRHPIRIELDENGRGAIELGFVNRRGHMCTIPFEGETYEGQFAHRPKETIHLSIAPGVSLTTSFEHLEDDRRTFESLPAPMRDTIVQRTVPEQRTLVVRHQTIWASLAVWPAKDRTIARQLTDELEPLADLAAVRADGPTPVDSRAGGAPQRTPCAYCATQFVVEVSDPRCPSCGAATK